jgi:ribosomal protein S18
MCSHDLQYQEFKLEGKEWKHYCHAFLKELKKYIKEEYKITKKRLDGISQTIKDLI